MRLPRSFAEFSGLLRRNWRIAPSSKFQPGADLFLRQLEERRVLTATVNAVVIAPAALAGMTEGDALSLEPGEGSGTGSQSGDSQAQDATSASTGSAQQDTQRDADAHDATELPQSTSATTAEAPNVTTPAGATLQAAPQATSDTTPTVDPPAAAPQTVTNGEGLSLTVSGNQAVNEGTQLSITDIGKFSDDGVGSGGNLVTPTPQVDANGYSYIIDWGDGRPVDTGVPTIDSQQFPTLGSFDGAHVYADNGVYTVTVTLIKDDVGSLADTFSVTVSNVAPTLTVPSNQTVNEGAMLNQPNIGQFTDPGFDNPLNVGGEVSEKFTYSINWGDGTAIDSGPATIDTPGSPGVPTAGSFDGSHIYADNGNYTVTVFLTDDDGGVAIGTFNVTVNNVAPTLTVPSNQTVNEDATLNLPNIGQFTDPGFDNPLNVGGEVSEKFTYSINWGDGTAIDSGPATIDTPGGPGVPTSGSFDGSHIYADNGVYTVKVTLTDDDGGLTVQTFNVTVNNVAPTLKVPSNQTVNEGATLNLPNIGQFTDPGFDNPLNSGETTETFTYSINWGDGTPLNTGVPTIDTPGGPGVPTAGSFDGSHIYADNGVYTVTVTVMDDDGGVTVQTFNVTVNNVAPTLTVPANQAVNEGATLNLPNIGQFTDPGFDNPLNVGGEVSEKFTYAINWGDGTAIDSGPATIDTPGSPGVPTAGSFDGSHIYADNGGYTVTVTLTDDDGGLTVQTFNVTVNNVAPTLTVPANQAVNEGATLNLPNIGQFTDPGFDNPLNSGETTETFTYSINWGDGTPLNTGVPTIDTPGGPGVPTAGSFDGSHIYADNGVYTVTVTVLDDDGGVTVQTFDVTVSNVAPTLAVPANQTVNEGATLNLPNIGQFTDPGFDNPLNIGGEVSEKFTYAINWGDGTAVDSGPATIDTPGGPGVLTAGSFDGSHIYADNGVYTVTVTVIDDDGGVSVKTFEVTVNNVATLTVPPNQTINEGATLNLPNIGQFTDPGFDNPLNSGETTETFTYSINWGDGTPLNTGVPTIDTPGGPGVPTAGSFDGSHIYADNGVYTVTVTVMDDDGGVTVQTFEVTVNNVAPTLTLPANQTINEGATLNLPNIGQFTDPGFDNPLNSGETTETFTYSINWGDGTPLNTGVPTIDTPGGPGVLTAGSFDGSHIYADNGVYTVTVTVIDDDGGVSVKTFEVTVNNVAPTLTVPPNQTINEGATLNLPNIGQFTDPGFDNPLNSGETTETFTYSINWGDGTPLNTGVPTIDTPGGPGVPTAGSFDGSHIYADNGVYTVTVTVMDDDGGVTVQTFEVTVNNVAPTLTLPANQTINEGATLNLPNIGQFTDPGFDNPLNSGETTETFTYSINWGDGTPLNTGVPTIDTPGGPGVLTAGSFDGSHIYADNGVYTVTVTVIDDDGGVSVETIEVTVNNVAPTLTVTSNQTINEGATLNLPNIGQFTDPGFDNPLNSGETTETFTYSINWGDGTPLNTGVPTIDTLGAPGVPTAGSFDGSHIYADNGVYTVTVTVMDDDGGVTVQTFEVTVNNVAPTLTVAPDTTVGKNAPLTINDIGQFTDPGFDNPLNVGGETTERFTYSINWGDGTVTDSGPGTIDTPGGPGVLTAGSFNGQHVYTTGGIYTVTVTVVDDDGGSDSGSFLVYVGPSLVSGPNQVVDEGAPLTVTNIGQFVDPTPVGIRPTANDPAAPYNYSINWGDGLTADSGQATMQTPGSPDVQFAGTFDGSHTYADNGLYTVTLTITSPDGRVDVATFQVTVNNVAPTLAPIPDQTVGQTRPLDLPNVGQFADPGFDNPLNVGGETTERFTYTINWGDGTQVSTGPGVINVAGHVGVQTAGVFSNTHVFAAAGQYTVTVTVRDDDGGAAVQTFQVTVAPLVPPNLIFLPPGGGGATPTTRPEVIEQAVRPVPQPTLSRTDFVRYRVAAVAGAEPRLVLRVVLPSGSEDQDHDEQLDNEVLDNLRKLFKRLPDGHYRIYLIQPDGIERLVVDVIVRQGRSIDATDEAADAGESPAGDGAPADTVVAPLDPASVPAAAVLPAENGGAEKEESAAVQSAVAAGAAAVVMTSSERRAARIVRGKRPDEPRSLSKASRLFRRPR